MTAQYGRNGSALPGVIGGLLILGVAALLWWSFGKDSGDSTMPSAMKQAASSGSPAAVTRQAKSAEPGVVRAPVQRITDQGRLTVSRESLREGDVLALGLDLPDAMRGVGPRAFKVVDVKGRLLEGEALPAEGAGSGLRLEIDPEWLRPGQYMIEVEVVGAGPLSIRRYVLEVEG